jgi:Ser/Thr protein kinase RdoA (MazF antagonist)
MLFPAVYSTLAPVALASYVAKEYELPECQGRLILRGVGDTYLITSGKDRFIMRAYRNSHRTLGQIQAEVELLLALNAAGVSVSFPIADRAGNHVQHFEAAEGTRYAVLFTYAHGDSPIILSPAQLEALGNEVGKFHTGSSTIRLSSSRWTFDTYTTLVEPMQRSQSFFESLPDELTWWLYATEKAKSILEAVPAEQLPSGYCHYDVLPKNFHFAGKQITLFDFDFLGNGWLINDVMTFWTQLCLDVQFNRMSQADADRSFDKFLNAYQRHRSVSQTELEIIPSLSIGWWCYYMGFHVSHDQFLTFVQPSHLKMRTALVRQLTEKNWHRGLVGQP